MPKLTEKGIAHILILLLLAFGIVIAVYLTQQTQIFNPHAQETPYTADQAQNRVPLPLEVTVASPVKQGDKVKVFWNNPWNQTPLPSHDQLNSEPTTLKQGILSRITGSDKQGNGSERYFIADESRPKSAKNQTEILITSKTIIADGKTISDLVGHVVYISGTSPGSPNTRNDGTFQAVYLRDLQDKFCAGAITRACWQGSPSKCQDFPTPCSVPYGWIREGESLAKLTPKPMDWVGLYFKSNENQAPDGDRGFKEWVYMGSCSRAVGQAPAAIGSCDFPIPTDKPLADGYYEFRMYTDNGFSMVIASNPFKIAAQNITCPNGQTYLRGACVYPPFTPECQNGQTYINGACVYPPVTPAPSACPNGQTYRDGACVYPPITQAPAGLTVQIAENKPIINPEDKVNVAWNNIYGSNRGPTATDWVGIYKLDSPDDTGKDASRVYLDWFYFGSCTRQIPKAPAVSGSCDYKLPKSVVPGSYDLRAFHENGFVKFSTSSPFSVDAFSRPPGM